MSIAIHLHDNDPAAFADVIARTMHGGAVIDREASLAHLSMLVATEEREEARRRAVWRWLGSPPTEAIDRDNDWSDV